MNEESPIENLQIWNMVKHTPAAFQKKVDQRGGYTSINTQFMIQEATKVFGPIGIGWGFMARYEKWQAESGDVMQEAYVTIWVVDRENTFGPILGMDWLVRKGRIDDDAPKKAMSDALKKGLSQLGVCAEIFLGQTDGHVDDDKYRNRKESEALAKIEEDSNLRRLRARLGDIIEDIRKHDKDEAIRIKTRVEESAMSVNALAGAVAKAESILRDLEDNSGSF